MEVFFSPGPTAAIVRELAKAVKSVHVRAYGFTSAAIADALIAAHQRGVVIDMVVDPCNASKYSQAPRCLAAGIGVMTDHKHAISHDKIMVIDELMVLTGSFNFTDSAERKNAENLLILESVGMAGLYITDHMVHKAHSRADMVYEISGEDVSPEELRLYEERMRF